MTAPDVAPLALVSQGATTSDSATTTGGQRIATRERVTVGATSPPLTPGPRRSTSVIVRRHGFSSPSGHVGMRPCATTRATGSTIVSHSAIRPRATSSPTGSAIAAIAAIAAT